MFALDRSEPKLKPGMSASVSVTVAERDNVLQVPSAAVTGSGLDARVTVVANGKQTTTPVVAGLKGDTVDRDRQRRQGGPAGRHLDRRDAVQLGRHPDEHDVDDRRGDAARRRSAAVAAAFFGGGGFGGGG